MQFPSHFFKMSFVSVCMVHPYSSVPEQIEQIGATVSSLLEKLFSVDFRRLGLYADKSRRNVFIIRNNGRREKRNVFLKTQRCFISIKQGAISNTDFRRIKSVHRFFQKSDAIYCHHEERNIV